MSVSLYDDALVEKIRNWTKNTNIHVFGANETKRVFEVMSDESNDKPIELPIILLRRKGGYSIKNTPKQPLSFDGKTYQASFEKSLQINSIPIQIEYQIDVYTRYQKEADEYVRNIVFNLINFPTLDIIIPYNGTEYPHQSTIHISSDVEDNSDITERLIVGQFTRFTLGLIVDDAYIWDMRVRDNIHIGLVECIAESKIKDDLIR